MVCNVKMTKHKFTITEQNIHYMVTKGLQKLITTKKVSNQNK